jgi:hypothetical protein
LGQTLLKVDLGQSQDYTAIAVMEYIKTSHVTIAGKTREVLEQFHVRHLQRLPLGLSYVEQSHHTAGLLRREPLSGACDFAIDETGVGRPCGDIFETAGLRPIRITITSGDAQTQKAPRRWHVAKQILISALDARLHTGELKIAPALTEAGTLREELREFRRHVSSAGRFSYEARVGKHDDLVLAIALALWCFTGRKKTPTAKIGRYAVGRQISWENLGKAERAKARGRAGTATVTAAPPRPYSRAVAAIAARALLVVPQIHRG